MNKKHNILDLKRVIGAAGFSLNGLRAALRHEAAFRQELALAVILLPLALYLGDTPVERVLLVAAIVLVLIVELLNSAIEAVVDRVGSEKNELSGRAKDMGSAAVLISLFLAAAIWFLVLCPCVGNSNS